MREERRTDVSRMMTIDEAKVRSLLELLEEIDESQESICVVLKAGHEIEIKPVPQLKPLKTLEGFVSEGWKDAIYLPQ